MKTLPKYYCIKRDESNPLWKKYIDWLNEVNTNKHKYIFDGSADFYGYDGLFDHNNYLSDFRHNAQLITLDFWDECVNGRKIVGYKVPCNISKLGWEKGDIAEVWIKNRNYHVPNKVNALEKEIVETWEAVYEEEKLEVRDWYYYSQTETSSIYFKGKLTQEKVDKIKEVINE